MLACPPVSTLFPYTTLFRSRDGVREPARGSDGRQAAGASEGRTRVGGSARATRRRLPLRLHRTHRQQVGAPGGRVPTRSEEHTSELQSRGHLVCRLLLEKKK